VTSSCGWAGASSSSSTPARSWRSSSRTRPGSRS
jgi:hypothetical protein